MGHHRQERPRFSFLSTAYRTEHAVSGMITSVLAQTDPDWELVVVDNGMSDEMARIVGSHAQRDARIVLVRQPNRGAAGGINRASAESSGRYVTLLNSDDRVLPDFCARLGDVLDSRPDLAAVTCDAWFTDATTGERLPASYLENAGAPAPDPEHVLTLPELIEGPCPYYTGAVRREVWDAHGHVDDAGVTVADLHLFLRIVAAGHRMVTLPERLASYTQAPQSLSRGGPAVLAVEQARERAVRAAAAHSDDPAVPAALERELRRSRHRRGVVGARVALFEGDVPAARARVRAALRERIDPRTLAVAAAVLLAPGPTRWAYRRARGGAVAAPAAPVRVAGAAG
jgi:cellulose synthase/poly-beta-1,6-N-acetylglucosamine synthase-like glycosyltransferase